MDSGSNLEVVRRKMRNTIIKHEPEVLPLVEQIFKAQDELYEHLSACKTCEVALLSAAENGETDGMAVQYCAVAKDLFYKVNDGTKIFNELFPPVESEAHNGKL